MVERSSLLLNCRKDELAARAPQETAATENFAFRVAISLMKPLQVL